MDQREATVLTDVPRQHHFSKIAKLQSQRAENSATFVRNPEFKGILLI
jgi:hypothetical protein